MSMIPLNARSSRTTCVNSVPCGWLYPIAVQSPATATAAFPRKTCANSKPVLLLRHGWPSGDHHRQRKQLQTKL
jgi:hypothetical protein